MGCVAATVRVKARSRVVSTPVSGIWSSFYTATHHQGAVVGRLSTAVLGFLSSESLRGLVHSMS